MDRRTIDEDLDDLTLDADLETSGEDDDVPTGLMAPPPKRASSSRESAQRTSARKSPARKPAPGASGNGRAESNGSAKPKSDDDAAGKEKSPSAESAAEETTVMVPAAAAVVADTTEDLVTGSSPAESAPLPESAPSAESAPAENTDAEPDFVVKGAAGTDTAGTGAAEDTPTEVVPSVTASPAMPADDIWTPRSSRSDSSTTSGWSAVETSDRPRGNAFEVNDAFSAPPMPSEPVTSRSPSFSSASLKQTSSRPSGTGDPDSGVSRPGSAASRRAGIAQPKATVRRPSARQAHLTIARVEPWSMMKFSFAVSVIAFVVLFVAVAVLYGVLSALGVFDSLQHLVTSVTSSQTSPGYNVRQWFSASRVLGYTALLGCLNIVLITAMSTIGAVIYNLTSRLIGGVEVTLRETD